MSAEQHEGAAGRLHPHIYLRGGNLSDVRFLRSVWYGATQSIDEDPEALLRFATNPELLDALVQALYSSPEIGYRVEWETVGGRRAAVLSPIDAGILLKTIVEQTEPVEEGRIVHAVTLPWRRIVEGIEQDHAFLFRFADAPRAFEEFIAACYDKAGWDEVVLTPQSGDRGRDVIAVHRGLRLRFIDQAKAFSPGRVVTADDVRAVWGVLNLDIGSTKAIISTTGRFAPGVYSEFERVIPYRLELRDGPALLSMLRGLRDGEGRSG
ncbi:MAG: restriction endonuclease [Longimicrobiales bacterium]